MWIGIAVGLGGHFLTILIGLVAAYAFSDPGPYNDQRPFRFLLVATIAQIVLMLAALIVGIIGSVKNDKRGVGLLIGWAVGLLISPVVGFGVCVALVNS